MHRTKRQAAYSLAHAAKYTEVTVARLQIMLRVRTWALLLWHNGPSSRRSNSTALYTSSSSRERASMKVFSSPAACSTETARLQAHATRQRWRAALPRLPTCCGWRSRPPLGVQLPPIRAWIRKKVLHEGADPPSSIAGGSCEDLTETCASWRIHPFDQPLEAAIISNHFCGGGRAAKWSILPHCDARLPQV